MRHRITLIASLLSVILAVVRPTAGHSQSMSHPPQLIGTWLSTSGPDTLGKISWTRYELNSDGSYVYIGGWGDDILLVLRGPWEVSGDQFYTRMDVIAPSRPIWTPKPGFVQVLTFSMPESNTLIIGNNTYQRITR